MDKDWDVQPYNFSVVFDIVAEKISGANSEGKGKGGFHGCRQPGGLHRRHYHEAGAGQRG